MDCDRMLAGSHVDNRGWGWEKPMVLCKVTHAKCGGHDNQSKRLNKDICQKSNPRYVTLHTFAPFFPSFHNCSRNLRTRLKTPMRISVFMLRSCASSMTITEYLFSRKSVASSRRSTPSVMNLIE